MNRDPRFLITAENAFPAMERLVLNATETLKISLHVFSPATVLRSSVAKEQSLKDWGALLADALQRNVTVYMLINDFDVVGGFQKHCRVSERIRSLEGVVDGLTPSCRALFHLAVMLPGGRSGWVIKTLAWPLVRKRAEAHRCSLSSSRQAVPAGLQAITEDQRIRFWPPANNFTQTLHQKFLIADDRHAIIGGLDLDERRYDDIRHRRSGPSTWHDVSIEVYDDDAAALAAHFHSTWRHCHKHGHSHWPLPDFAGLTEPGQIRAPEGRRNQLVSTMAAPSKNPFAFGPSCQTNDIERACIETISAARHLLYLETQYMRSSSIISALETALSQSPRLRVIALLPGAPDAIAFEGDRSPVRRYGEWLQTRGIRQLSTAFPDRFAAYALTNAHDREAANERDALFGKAMVYVHSKVLIADGETAIVSSANLNGRSMRWDIEAGFVIRNTEFASGLQQALWAAHLAKPGQETSRLDDGDDAFECWAELARERAALGAEAKGTGPVPFPLRETQRFAKRHFFIPEEMV